MDPSREPFTAIVLAADREPENPVAAAAGVPCKALAPVCGIPMVLRVLGALSSAAGIGDRMLCGPPRSIVEGDPGLAGSICSGRVRWVEPLATPSASAYHAMQTLPHDALVLLTTADHPLLSPRIVSHFCAEARSSGCDVVAALALRDTVTEAYPKTRRTAYRIGKTAYCTCNLFAFLTPAAREAALFWRRVESRRKRPLRVVHAFGWAAVLQYLIGRLTLEEALDRISRRLALNAGVVVMPCPEAAIDVDSVDDWRYAEEIAATNKNTGQAHEMPLR